MKRTAVIMAGGSGERFWPMSRKRKPKQLLPLATEKTMIEESIERISPLISAEDVFIITSEILLEPLRKALPVLPHENIVAEPYKRNTAPCLALAAAFIAEKYSKSFSPSEISIAVLTADQSITPMEKFTETVDGALSFVEKNKAICTIGIQPSRPETGYGYIEVDRKDSGLSNNPDIIPVVRFREKPDLETAQHFLESNNFLWNSGMFFWRLDVFIESMIKYLPEVGSKIDILRNCYQNETGKAFFGPHIKAAPVFEAFPDISIDYGLMEKADNVYVARALFSWDDIGSWDSLDRVRQSDNDGNIIHGNNSVFDTKNSVIINSSTKDHIIFAGFGLENMVVVVTDDAVLVCPKDRVQEVKKCVELIKKKDGHSWL